MAKPPPRMAGFSVHLEGPVAILAYDRPQSGNSLHFTVLQGLLDAMKWASETPAVRVIVQTGTGRFFTTGMDLDDGSDAVDNDKIIQIFREINETLITCKKVLIAAVNGPAVGYGTTSLGLYDLVYSVEGAYFFTPFGKLASCPEGCSSITFPSIMGHQKAMALLLAGERMSAQELCDAGLITKIIPASTNEAFMSSVLEVAKRIADYPPVALTASKSLIQENRMEELLRANIKECEGLRVRLSHQEMKMAQVAFAKEQERKKQIKQDTRNSKL
ncbi:ClpP/crotonase-like domain-containing protein [Thelonectria olida]|uniref:ClpP/crotonase-like domain-containing protein n=1 Tax=Thelonectria olida TaxID=1576542 RepID=A0A9P8VVZ7_9HYPO|nr:ClpP/crotonase-like domain-containing protein [Thelonectria olida]